MNRFTSTWIDSCMNHLIFVWNDSSNSLTLFESIQTQFESYQTSYGFLESSHFSLDTYHLFTWCESIQTVSESIQSVFLVWKFSSSLFSYILFFPLNSKGIESFASILSRSQKLIVHTFFKIKHFFLESLCSLSA